MQPNHLPAQRRNTRNALLRLDQDRVPAGGQRCSVAVLQFESQLFPDELAGSGAALAVGEAGDVAAGGEAVERQRGVAVGEADGICLQRQAGKVADIHAGGNRGDYKADSERDFNRRRGVNTCEADDAVFVFVVVFGCSLRSLKYFPPRILCNRPVVS